MSQAVEEWESEERLGRIGRQARGRIEGAVTGEKQESQVSPAAKQLDAQRVHWGEERVGWQ